MSLQIIEEIIHKVARKLHPGKRFYLHFADDRRAGNGYAFKIHRNMKMDNIWNPILKELKKNDIEWYKSVPYYNTLDEDGNKITVQSSWNGIRSTRQRRAK